MCVCVSAWAGGVLRVAMGQGNPPGEGAGLSADEGGALLVGLSSRGHEGWCAVCACAPWCAGVPVLPRFAHTTVTSTTLVHYTHCPGGDWV